MQLPRWIVANSLGKAAEEPERDARTVNAGETVDRRVGQADGFDEGQEWLGCQPSHEVRRPRAIKAHELRCRKDDGLLNAAAMAVHRLDEDHNGRFRKISSLFRAAIAEPELFGTT